MIDLRLTYIGNTLFPNRLGVVNWVHDGTQIHYFYTSHVPTMLRNKRSMMEGQPETRDFKS
ncbi:unnamed protein product [Dovyalis caffra]|uniref:Uncharacterized protein n=1 Tax=Dovyalis caffra TaxID=77055 RepID=A0AAV1RFD8_9ROSI|nr:unnamed protein product [Dovyalis caffra]